MERFTSRQAFAGTTAIITGGASGIGRALGTALAGAGTHVVLADIDIELSTCAADEIGERGAGSAERRQLDVRDRAAVAALVEEVVAERGAIDYFVNNAGTSMGGPTHELTGAHWDRIIDVNLTGVVNGVLAAYPRMVAQGHGHIVNVASAAGLAPPPFVVPYAATKHAVVGLSVGLRPEAALHGVRVTALCPGAVDTPILDRLPPDDLPATASAPVTARAYLARLRQRPMAPDAFARAALRDIRRNRAISVIPRSAKVLWYLQRLSPSAMQRASASMARVVARDLVRPRSQSD